MRVCKKSASMMFRVVVLARFLQSNTARMVEEAARKNNTLFGKWAQKWRTACQKLRDGSFVSDMINITLRNTSRMDTVVVNMRRRF
jgi:uncharacterized protein (DUF2147 family)